MGKKISIIIVTYNSENHIYDCLESIHKYNDIGDELEIIIVDNMSKEVDSMFSEINNRFGQKIILIKNDRNGGYGQGNNIGVKKASGSIIMIMNPDVRLIQPLFKRTINHFQNSKVVMLGMVQMVSAQKRGLSFMSKLDTNPILSIFETIIFNKILLYNSNRMYFSGASFFIRKNEFENIGMFQEDVFMYGEENDLHHRLINKKSNMLIVFDRHMRYLHMVDDRPPTIKSAIQMLNASVEFYAKMGHDSRRIILNREISREVKKAVVFKVINQIKGNKDRVRYYVELLDVLKKTSQKSNICCIFNVAPHYNATIYSLMDEELKCDFYLGDQLSYPIKLMNYKKLAGYTKTLKNIQLLGNFYWQKGAVSLVFKPYKCYVITGEPYVVSTWIVLLLNKFAGKKSYLWTHGWYGNESKAKKWLKKIFFGLSEKVLLYGEYAKNLMINEGFKEENLITIFNSLDYEKQVKVRKELSRTSIYQEHFQNTFPVLLYIGRIQIRKKIELLIDAVKLLHENQNFCNLILIGEQVDDTTISEMVLHYGLEKSVWFYGPSYDENKIGELIYNANVCVSPGNVGLTAMHSLVYGTPVITQNNFARQMPEFEAIMPGLTGDFFVEDVVEDLCSKINDWISIDEEKRESVRQECYKVIHEKYNPNVQIKTLKSLLKR